MKAGNLSVYKDKADIICSPDPQVRAVLAISPEIEGSRENHGGLVVEKFLSLYVPAAGKLDRLPFNKRIVQRKLISLIIFSYIPVPGIHQAGVVPVHSIVPDSIQRRSLPSAHEYAVCSRLTVRKERPVISRQ